MYIALLLILLGSDALVIFRGFQRFSRGRILTGSLLVFATDCSSVFEFLDRGYCGSNARQAVESDLRLQGQGKFEEAAKELKALSGMPCAA